MREFNHRVPLFETCVLDESSARSLLLSIASIRRKICYARSTDNSLLLRCCPHQDIENHFQNAIGFACFRFPTSDPKNITFWLSAHSTSFRVLPRRIPQIKIDKAPANISYSLIFKMESADIPHICLHSVMGNMRDPDHAMKYRQPYPSWRRM